MATCIYCASALEDGALICDLCGSSQPDQPSRRAPASIPALPPRVAASGKGSPRLILYGPDRRPRQEFPLGQDVTLIGRLDVAEGNFPDIDLSDWLDEGLARKVSRNHVLILRQRASQSVSLRPLPGNSGTQLETEMIGADQDHPLHSGARFILGGAVRFKFENQ